MKNYGHSNTKSNYDCLREQLILEPVLYYQGKEYWISYDETRWYFTEVGGNGANSKTFVSGDDLLDNATIDGKLLSEIWGDVALIGGSMCSEIKIVLSFSSVNLNFEEITEKMEMQPTKTIKLENPKNEWFSGTWYYIAFIKEEDAALTVFEKTAEFAKMMAGKEEVINMLKEKYKDNNIISVALVIDGNPFINTTNFVLSPDFCAFAHKINTPIVVNAYRVQSDKLKEILNNKYL